MNRKEFLDKWLCSFAPNISKSQYNKYIHNQYIWHAFSWNIIPKDQYLEGNEAREAYNYTDKEGAICFQLRVDEVPMPLTEKFDSAEKIESTDGGYSEFYVVGKDFSWTFIVTHETGIGLGPYFMKIK